MTNRDFGAEYFETLDAPHYGGATGGGSGGGGVRIPAIEMGGL